MLLVEVVDNVTCVEQVLDIHVGPLIQQVLVDGELMWVVVVALVVVLRVRFPGEREIVRGARLVVGMRGSHGGLTRRQVLPGPPVGMLDQHGNHTIMRIRICLDEGVQVKFFVRTICCRRGARAGRIRAWASDVAVDLIPGSVSGAHAHRHLSVPFSLSGPVHTHRAASVAVADRNLEQFVREGII